MVKVLYSVTMSLDGFIAGAGGDMSWLAPHAGPDPLATEVMERTGAILAGGRTYRGSDPNEGTDAEGAFGGAWHGPEFVLTRTPPRSPVPGVTFVTDLGRALTAAKAAAGDGYVNVLGAATARACLEAGELDEILTFVAPVLLGDGVRLFAHPGGTNVALERIRVEHTPQATALWFRVVR
ncbi:MAG: dihydrofolate reductase family protein [Pseudonocardia sp.]